MIASDVSEIDRSFPFRTFREGQREALDAIRGAFADGVRFVVLEAPTGTGKSALGIAVAHDAESAYLVTAQKILQEQYLRDFPTVAPMKGRSNYPCLVVDSHAAAAPCLIGHSFPACDDCPYFRAKDVALAAQSTVTNYAYALAESQHAGTFQPRDVLILDEAHGIETALMRFVEVRIDAADLVRAGAGSFAWSSPLDLVQALEDLEDLVPLLRRRRHDASTRLESAPPTAPATVAALRSLRWMDATLPRIEMLLDSVASEEASWVLDVGPPQGSDRSSREPGPSYVAFRPVDVASFAEPLLFRLGARVLMMSATLLDPQTFLHALGIEPSDACWITVPSNFPADRRPLHVRPVAKLTRAVRDRDVPKLIAAVADVMRDHPTEKGIVHTHSYALQSALLGGLPADLRARIVTHDEAAGRDDALTQHLSDRRPTVLASPSMTEGIDLADDAARWQVICKLPYPYLGDPQVAARSQRDPRWYGWRTAMTLVQAYGRTVRSEDDYAVTYLFDADAPTFLRRERDRLPTWFSDALIVET